MFFFNFGYILFVMVPALVIGGWASMRVQNAYKKYMQVQSVRGVTGGQLANLLLQQNGLGMSNPNYPDMVKMGGDMVKGFGYGVRVFGDTANALENHYDPRDKTLHLSPQVYNSASIASLAIVSHEVGHALQDAQGYQPMKLRGVLVPAAQFSSSGAIWLIIIGLFMGSAGLGLAWAGVGLMGIGVLFYLATLPVELNASKRGLAMLSNTGVLVTPDEQKGAKTVLSAAAWTYVAALLTALLQFLYFASLLGGGNRR
jgi:Zn-dependent membrane protease YugP